MIILFNCILSALLNGDTMNGFPFRNVSVPLHKACCADNQTMIRQHPASRVRLPVFSFPDAIRTVHVFYSLTFLIMHSERNSLTKFATAPVSLNDRYLTMSSFQINKCCHFPVTPSLKRSSSSTFYPASVHTGNSVVFVAFFYTFLCIHIIGLNTFYLILKVFFVISH